MSSRSIRTIRPIRPLHFVPAVLASFASAQEGPVAVPPPAPAAPAGDHDHDLGPFRLLEVSLDLLFAAGTSTERDAALQDLQAGGHDPRKRGFTLQNTELGIRGAVGSWLAASAYLIYLVDPVTGESRFELEEASAITTALPYGLEVEAGQMFSEFGLHNPLHPHDWDFLDQPVVHSRVFGADGIRGPGIRVAWQPALPWFAKLHAGVQNANGETMASFLASDELFEERPIGGRPFTDREVRSLADLVWLARLEQAWELDEHTTLALGASSLFGPNATGGDADTSVFGIDLLLRFGAEVDDRETTILEWRTEYLRRRYDAAAFTDEGDPALTGDEVFVPGEKLEDQGFYSQALYRFAPRFAAGLRVEHATGSGRSIDPATFAPVGRGVDPFRDDRWRVSPLLQWDASDHVRLRLQYNHDDADHLPDGEAHSVWLGVELALGRHAHEH